MISLLGVCGLCCAVLHLHAPGGWPSTHPNSTAIKKNLPLSFLQGLTRLFLSAPILKWSLFYYLKYSKWIWRFKSIAKITFACLILARVYVVFQNTTCSIHGTRISWPKREKQLLSVFEFLFLLCYFKKLHRYIYLSKNTIYFSSRGTSSYLCSLRRLANIEVNIALMIIIS